MVRKATKTTRNMKVLEQSGYKYKPTPAIMLKGQWLAEFGFDIATPVQVQCEDDRLIITKAVPYPEPEQLKVAEEKGSYGSRNGGKTSIVLTAVNELMYERFEIGKVLIIAPLRVARNTWPREIEKWDHLMCSGCSEAFRRKTEDRHA